MAKSDVDAGVPSDLSAGGDCYPSDLRDAEWARLEPLIPKASPGGRPPNTDMRAALPHTPRTLGRRVDQRLPRQRDEFERRKDGLHLSAAAVVNRTSFVKISSCSLATRSCPVRDPG